MGQPLKADERLEVVGNELRAVVADDPGMRPWTLLQCSLQYKLNVDLPGGFADFPVHDVAAVAIEYRDQEVQSPSEIHIADIGVPVSMGTIRLHESAPLLAGRPLVSVQPASGLEDPVRRRRAHRRH